MVYVHSMFFHYFSYFIQSILILKKSLQALIIPVWNIFHSQTTNITLLNVFPQSQRRK